MQRRFELPEPSADALEHSSRLAQVIAARIRDAGGWIDFADYMDLALYAPALGYYSAGAAKFGPQGDFVTAPETSPLFGRCLASACVPWLRANRGGSILELGAGTGALAAEVLSALERNDALPGRYLILEVSGELRERQRLAISLLPARLAALVDWIERLPAQPLRAVVLANEVVDALPVSVFSRCGTSLLARGVALSEGGFEWALRPASAELARAVSSIEDELGAPLPEGYTSEVCLRLPAWIGALAAVLGDGLVLLSDYGMSRREYYHPQRRSGTLACHYRHRVHANPFFHPGLQDITAWVDFTAVAAAAAAAGLAVAGYATQAHFLLDTGLDRELSILASGTGRVALEAARQAKTLLLPGEMGERFKVLALARGKAEIPGFGFRDLRHLL
jgi:SAM-dependent MidA family methyltransferase